jgi:branched-chain amino acid aminotransferase
MGFDTGPCKAEIAVLAWSWPSVWKESQKGAGIRLMVSSWRRHDHNIMPPHAKTVGNYVNSSLAKAEAKSTGYDDAVLLNPAGLVAECTAENIFVVRDAVIYTPPGSAGRLDGITKDSVSTIARDLGYEVQEAELVRSDLYVADEIFVTGTAAEVANVQSVDGRALTSPGPVYEAVSEVYRRATRRADPRYLDWCELAT